MTDLIHMKIKDIIKEKKSKNQPVVVELTRYFNCPVCDHVVQTGDHVCPYCGAMFDDIGNIVSNPTVDKIKYFFRRKKAAVIVIAALVASMAGVDAGVDYMTAFSVPDVSGMTAVEAQTTLYNAGFDPDDVSFYCDETLSDSDVEDGEYEVISQSVPAGEKVHSDDGIFLECNDIYKERTEAITACRYEKAEEAIRTAKQYDYTYELTDIAKDNGFEQSYRELSNVEKNNFYVYEIASISDDDRSVIFKVDSKKNIEKEISRLFTGCVDEHVSDAKDIAKSLDFEVECKDYNGSSASANSDRVIIGLEDVDFTDKSVVLKTDTEQHIEDVKIISTLKDKIPYKGLKERYISDTAVGDYDRSEDSDDDYDLGDVETAYYWMSDDGKYDVLKVVCRNGTVRKVGKKYKKVYWKSSLPDFSADKDAYDAEVAARAAARAAKKEKEAAREAEKEAQVWIPRSGSCYHSNEYCSNMKNPTKVSLSTGKSMGYRACSKCY